MNFMYTSISRLRGEGLTEVECPDARARERIAMVSEMINRITGQYFLSLYEAARKLSGRGSSLMFHPKFVPIIQIDGLLLAPLGDTPETLDWDTYLIHNQRFVARTGYTSSARAGSGVHGGIFMEGYGN